MPVFRKLAAAALLVFATLPTAAYAQAKSFNIGVEQTEYYPIYSYRNNQWVGYSRELLDAFAAKKGYQFTYTPLPILRLFVDFLKKDELDFKFPDNPQWRTDLKGTMAITYSKPAFEGIEGSMVLPARVGKGIAAVKTLGTIRGFTPWPYQDAISAQKVFNETTDTLASLVQKTLAGRTDAMFINTAIADYHMAQELKKPGALVLDKGLPNNPVAYLLSTRKHPAIIAEFDAFLASEKALVAQLKAKYKLK